MAGITLNLDTSDLVTRLMRIENTLARMEGELLASQTLTRMENKLDIANTGISKIMADESAVATLLTKIDTATTAIGNNVQSIASNVNALGTTASQISSEVDTLVAGMQNAGVSQALIDQATAVGTKMDTLAGSASDTATATSNLVPVLSAIATKGAGNPVPVPVPVPVPPVSS